MKSKKLLLGSLSAMALVATPIATVVSCGKDAPAAKVTKTKAAAKVTKTKAEGFVLTVNAIDDYYITPELASKAGSIKIGKKTYKWDAAMKADTKVTDATVAAASKDGFAVPNKDGILEYAQDLDVFKDMMDTFFVIFQGKTDHSTIVIKPAEMKKSSDAKLSEESITAINDFISASGWKVKSATIAIALNPDQDAVYQTGTSMDIVWEEITKTPAKTGTGTGTGTATTAKAKADADITAVKSLFTTAAITGANTTAVTAVTTASTTGITAMPTIAGVTWTHAFPTALNGVKVTVKSIDSVAATSGATGNIVLELTKGTGTAQTVTIAITHA